MGPKPKAKAKVATKTTTAEKTATSGKRPAVGIAGEEDVVAKRTRISSTPSTAPTPVRPTPTPSTSRAIAGPSTPMHTPNAHYPSHLSLNPYAHHLTPVAHPVGYYSSPAGYFPNMSRNFTPTQPQTPIYYPPGPLYLNQPPRNQIPSQYQPPSMNPNQLGGP
jgi:hypothetical protein